MRLRGSGKRVQVAVAGCVVCTAALLFAAPASAGVVTYPAGGSGFDEGAEGWSSGGGECSPAELLCTSEATYDASSGSPPGSIAAKTTVTLNLVSLFKGTATWDSPQFQIAVATITGAELHLDRAFSPGGLVDVGPEATYVVKLSDLTAGTSSPVLSGVLDKEDEAYAPASAPVAVVGGHTYQLSIESVTAQSTFALSALSGTTKVHFDNVGIAVQTASSGKGGKGSGSGGGGENKGSGSNSSALSDKRLLTLLRGGAVATPAVLRGRHLLVKVNCPAKIRRACHVLAQGMLTRKRAATRGRVVKIGRGKGRRVVLPVKPRLRPRLAKRRRILVRERVRAGKARATIYKRRKLIRRPTGGAG
jgi:hypothetical protein